jgi:sporulation protein YhbH
MIRRIEQDKNRFQQIVRGRVRKEFRKYITRGELIGKRGKDLVSIPVPQIDIPRFRFGGKEIGGVGQGDGAPGTPLGPDEQGQASGAGDQPGEHILEVDISLEELAQMLGEELELPNIEPKGKKNIVSAKEKYTGIHRVGPESLRHFKRTYKEALKRQLITGSYDPVEPRVVPVREDKRYRSWKVTHEPECNAVIIHMLDVSGSMGDEQKEIVRIEAFWIDTWLRSQYNGVEARYIIHDAAAREVDQQTFYHTRESGGTKISSAYKLCNELIDRHYNPAEWNIYPFHFSDGDNWSEDNEDCMELLEEQLLPKCNLFCYGQVANYYGGGDFVRDLEEYFGDEEKLVTSEIDDRDAIYDSIKEFLGKGR